MAQMEPREKPRALRLNFRFEGDVVELASAEPLEMIAPRSPGEPPEGGESAGPWLELQDPGRRVLFYTLMHDPFHQVAEHHHPDGSIERVVRQVDSGTFDVLVPDLVETDEAVLWSPPIGIVDGRATKETRFPLREGGAAA